MAGTTLETKAHELLGQVHPSALATVVEFLEVMVRAGDEPVTEDELVRFKQGQAWFAQRNGHGIAMEDVLAEFGLREEDFPVRS